MLLLAGLAAISALTADNPISVERRGKLPDLIVPRPQVPERETSLYMSSFVLILATTKPSIITQENKFSASAEHTDSMRVLIS